MKDEIMKSTNFEFLRPTWNELADLGAFAEQYIHTDPQSAQMKSRLLAERIAMLTCMKVNLPVSGGFLSILKDLEHKKILPSIVLDLFHLVRMAGNESAHQDNLSNSTLEVVKSAFRIAQWWYVYDKKTKDNLIDHFQDIVPTIKIDEKAEAKQLKNLESLNEKLIKENEELRKKHQNLTTAEVETIRQDFTDSAQSLNFNEAQTRKFLIDLAIEKAGWRLQNSDDVGQEVELFEQGTYSGKGYADYILYDDDGTALAVIEAKRPRTELKTARKQAQDYADYLQKQNPHQERPIIILTNGYETLLIDDKGGPKSLNVQGYADRNIYGIPSKESLQYRVKFQQKQMHDPATLTIRTDIAGRPYQLEAIKAVAERFGEQRRRKALIVQATGTGKTRVAIAITELLMRANFAKRILFLCDRKELRKQAKNAYLSFLPDRKVELLKKSKESDVEITIATYPAMIQRFQEYDIAHFDLIIADESHRSIYNKYRDLFIYFDAYQLGLTATPRNVISHNTYDIFECDEGDPTYYYEYEKAIADGYLVDFKAISVTTKFLREGIDSQKLSIEDIKLLEEDGYDVDEISASSSQINSRVYVKGTNQAILRNLMENGLQDVSQNGPGKSIIFARNIKHATLLQTWFQEMYPEYGPDYCALIHSGSARSDSLIDEFKDPTKNPVIAISVDMLDTGIDVPEVLNLVFAKPVKSWVKFWQMIGRGTRLCQNLMLDENGNTKDKDVFYIFDHYGNFEYFEDGTHYEEAGSSPSVMERLLESRLDLASLSLEKFNKDSFERTIVLIRQMLQSLPEKSLPVQEKLRIKNQVLLGDTLESYAPATVTAIRNKLMPLMRYVPLDNPKAYSFDILMTEVQQEILLESARLEDLKGHIRNLMNSLATNIEAVRALFSEIEEIISEDFWNQEKKILLPAIENKRLQLRGIMQYVKEGNNPPFTQKVISLADKDLQVKEIPSARPSKNQMQGYFQRVRSVLEPHFQTNPSLQKLRKGEKLSEVDFNALVSLTLTQNAQVDLSLLREYYPNMEAIIKVLRSIVGMDGEFVRRQFLTFYNKYTNLSSVQMAFMNLLQKHIAEFGPIHLQSLYEAPFNRLHANGPDGIFSNETQLQDLFNILQSFEQNLQAEQEVL